MKRITITLTEDEFAALEKHATDERRSVREMAAYLVAKNTPALPSPTGTLTIRGMTTYDPRFTAWNANICAAAPSIPINVPRID